MVWVCLPEPLETSGSECPCLAQADMAPKSQFSYYFCRAVNEQSRVLLSCPGALRG